jgi:hypothetical protein
MPGVLWFELKSVVFNHATRNKDSPQSVAACAVEPYCIPDAIIVDVGFSVEYINMLLHNSLLSGGRSPRVEILR